MGGMVSIIQWAPTADDLLIQVQLADLAQRFKLDTIDVKRGLFQAGISATRLIFLPRASANHQLQRFSEEAKTLLKRFDAANVQTQTK